MACESHRRQFDRHAPAPAAVNAAIASALEDVGPTIAQYREVTLRLAKLQPGTRGHAADTAFARDLLDQLNQAARRIELEDGTELTGEALVRLAIADRRVRDRLPANPARATERTLHEDLMRAMAVTTAARHALTAAQAALIAAQQAERAADAAYRALGTSPLVTA